MENNLELEELEKEYHELWIKIKRLKELEEKEEKQKDFNKFISRKWDTIVIKGTFKSILSYGNWDINLVDNKNLENIYNDNITYIETTFWELKKWDVFVLENEINSQENNNKIQFKIFIWTDSKLFHRYYFLNKENLVEFIDNLWYLENKDNFMRNKVVYRINRI